MIDNYNYLPTLPLTPFNKKTNICFFIATIDYKIILKKLYDIFFYKTKIVYLFF